nr:MAG TPA: hypothetical protein [Caudoviricetes sp.]
MNSSILTAIESLCDDIATNTNPEENKKRAEAVVSLAFVGIFTPAEYDDEYEDKTSEGKAAPVADVSKVPQAGEQFEYNGVKFTALGEERGGVLAIVSELLKEEMPLDKSNKNDWRTSSLRKYLNGEYLEQFNRGDLLPFVSDLTSDDGMKDYGTAEDYVFLLSCDLYRKYRESVPRFNNWWWTLTPWTCSPSHANYARIVYSSGEVNNSGACYGLGVAPACLFNPKIFE